MEFLLKWTGLLLPTSNDSLPQTIGQSLLELLMSWSRLSELVAVVVVAEKVIQV